MNVFNHIEKFSSNIATITEDSKKITYKELLIDSKKISNKISNNTLVLIICINTLEFLQVYVGCTKAKIPMMFVDSEITEIAFKKLLSQYRPGYLYIPKNKNKLSNNFTRIFNNGIYALYKTNFNNIKLNKDLSLLLSTSGSTGSAKYVKLSYKNISSNAIAISKYLKISYKDRSITTMKANYTFGLSIINSHLIKGASIILTQKTILDKKFWNLFKKNKPTTFSGVSFIFEILKKLNFEKMNLPSLRYITHAGGKLDNYLQKEFIKMCKKKRIKFFSMYGQTEATSRMSYVPWNKAITKLGSIGIPIPGGKFSLEDSKHKIINTNDKIGELIYKGDNVFIGYAENYKDLVKVSDKNKILHTGDIAKKDKDGFYYIIGRKKRFIKLYGNRINLDEIEDLIKLNGYECACNGKDECINIYLVKTGIEKKVINLITKHMNISKRYINFKIIKNIPRTHSGKIRYNIL